MSSRFTAFRELTGKLRHIFVCLFVFAACKGLDKWLEDNECEVAECTGQNENDFRCLQYKRKEDEACPNYFLHNMPVNDVSDSKGRNPGTKKVSLFVNRVQHTFLGCLSEDQYTKLTSNSCLKKSSGTLPEICGEVDKLLKEDVESQIDISADTNCRGWRDEEEQGGGPACLVATLDTCPHDDEVCCSVEDVEKLTRKMQNSQFILDEDLDFFLTLKKCMKWCTDWVLDAILNNWNYYKGQVLEPQGLESRSVVDYVAKCDKMYLPSKTDAGKTKDIYYQGEFDLVCKGGQYERPEYVEDCTPLCLLAEDDIKRFGLDDHLNQFGISFGPQRVFENSILAPADEVKKVLLIQNCDHSSIWRKSPTRGAAHTFSRSGLINAQCKSALPNLDDAATYNPQGMT